jgi:tellurite resistance protein TerA
MTIDYTKTTRPQPQATQPSGKVVLTKTKPSISLTKPGGQLRINLNWDARPPMPASGGFLKRLGGVRPIDLDLGCLYELTDGSKGVVQALGNAFGHLEQPPFIRLSGDDRSGTNTAGEDLFVNLAHSAQIRRVLIFACIYDGASSFDQANGVVTVSPAAGPPIEVRLDDRAGGSRMCAVALLEGGPTDLTIHREVRYIKGAQDALDRAYDWGMRWAAGRK